MTLFQEFILISLGKKEKFSHRLADNDWNSLYHEAQRQSLVGVLMIGVERAIASGEHKPKFLMQWIAQVMTLEQRNKLLNARCKEITEKFNSLGFGSCVLKGQGVARLYPNPLRRQCGDIDLWVEGNRDDIYKTLKAKWTVGETVIHHADMEIFEDVPTEIHFIPSFTYSPFRYNRYKRFFKCQENKQFAHIDENMGFAYPTTEFNAVYSLMHIFHHVLHEGIGLRQLLDYYYILMSLEDDSHRNRVYTELKHLGLTRFVAAVMHIEQQMFALEDKYLLCKPDERLGNLLLREIELAGNFGQYDERNKSFNRKNRLLLYWHHVNRNFLFFKFAPNEALWAPIWKPCHFVWRKIKGYR